MVRAAAITKAFIGFVLWAGPACITLAQQADVTQPPPKITFQPWRETDRTEFYRTYEVAFPSAVTTGYPENDRVPLKVFLPTETFGRVPVVILLHYWGATDDRIEQDMAVHLAKQGVASVLMPLPFHLDRTPKGHASGEMAVVPDIGKLRANTLQAVLDVRRTVDWIVSRPEFDASRIGLAGTSLGAMVSALAYAVEPRFSVTCFLLGGVDVAHILWHSSRVVSQREDLRKQGYTEDRVRSELKSVEPLTYLKPDDRRPSLVISAKFDTVIPP
ncbi:MAG TPA: CocE/NonD family hydrolase, partial [Fimbriimonadaceae bacterium]|nr:CocE/NonD family hydrolase [Fimbriimonadaceae bacterium]